PPTSTVTARWCTACCPVRRSRRSWSPTGLHDSAGTLRHHGAASLAAPGEAERARPEAVELEPAPVVGLGLPGLGRGLPRLQPRRAARHHLAHHAPRAAGVADLDL